MKVAFAMVAAWWLRAAYLFSLADRIEEWAGINYDPDGEFEWDGMLARIQSEVDQGRNADESI